MGEVKGVQECIQRIEAIKGEMPRMAATALLAGALVVNNDAVRRAPYLTGNLRRSIHPDPVEANNDRVVIEVGTDVEYAAHLEFGTVRMAPRPYLRPALLENKAKIVRDSSVAFIALLRNKSRGGS